MANYSEPVVPTGDVPRRLREELHSSRERHESFDDAWTEVLTTALHTMGDFYERKRWAKALQWTKPRWEAAFNLDEPTQPELSLSFCAMDRGVPGGRTCEFCDQPVTGGPRAIYCGKSCASKASKQRVAA